MLMSWQKDDSEEEQKQPESNRAPSKESESSFTATRFSYELIPPSKIDGTGLPTRNKIRRKLVDTIFERAKDEKLRTRLKDSIV